MKNTTKKARIEYVKDRMKRDDRFAVDCLLAVYDADDGMRTGKGFRNCDSRIMCSFARQHRDGRNLSESQMGVVQKVIPRYARQLVEKHIPEHWLDAEMASRQTVAAASGSRIEGDNDLAGWARVREMCEGGGMT